MSMALKGLAVSKHGCAQDHAALNHNIHRRSLDQGLGRLTYAVYNKLPLRRGSSLTIIIQVGDQNC